MKKILICSAMLLAAGCAKPPEDIMATSVSADPFMRMECPQLAQIKMQKDGELATLAKHQDQVARNDAAAMVVVHVPISKVSGADKSEEIARLKGETQAVDMAYRSKNCGAG